MGLFSRGGSILAASISKDANWRQPVNAIGARVLGTWQLRQRRRNHGVGSEVQMECGDVAQEQRQLLRKLVDVAFVCHASSRPVEVDRVGHCCGYGEVNSQVGFRVLSHGERFIPHVEYHFLREVKNCWRRSLEIGPVKEITCRGMHSDMQERIRSVCTVIAEDPTAKVLACGEEIMRGSIGGLALEDFAPGTDCGPNSLEIGVVKKINRRNVDTNAEQCAECELKGNMKSTERDGRATEANIGIVYESSETIVAAINSEGTTGEDAIPTDQIELVQKNEVNLPLDNLPSNCGAQDGDSQYPVPLSPLSGELAKSIECERAMVAETAVKTGPAMTRSGVLFEDEWLMVINKPCGVYCEHVLATIPSLLTPAADVSSLSRLTLRRSIDNKNSSVPHLHMANRLDRDTSGVMVITKCRNAAGKLSNIFTKRQVQKSYIALCRGPRPSWKSLTVDSGHGRSRYGAWRVYSKKDVGRGLPGGSVVRDMTTHLLVLAINKQLVLDEQVVGSFVFDKLKDIECLVTAGDESSSSILGHSPSEKSETCSEVFSHDSQLSIENDEVVIRAIPLTGRTHQIRLHCQFVGLPLRGDVKYGGPHFVNGVRYDHHALHAETLSFRHPFTFEELHFVAPLPQWAIHAGVQPLVV